MVSYIGDPSILDDYQLLPRQNTPGVDLGAVGQPRPLPPRRPNDKFLGPGTSKFPRRPPVPMSELSIMPNNPSLFPRRPAPLMPYGGGGIGSLFNQLAYMDPERFDTSMQRFQTFRDQYGNMMGPGGYQQQMGLFNTLGRLNPEQFDIGMQRLQTYRDLFQPSYGGPITTPGFPTPTGPKPPIDVPVPVEPPMMDDDGAFGGGKQAPIDPEATIRNQFPGFNPGSATLDQSGNVLPDGRDMVTTGGNPSPYQQPVNPMQSQRYFGGFGSPRNPYASGYGMGYQPPPYMPMTGRVGFNPMGRMGYGAFGGGGYYSPSASSPSGGKGGGIAGPGQAYMGGSGGGKGGAA